jgi:WhiB family transcriptional regulator, redox-sensing transcriptional regulator
MRTFVEPEAWQEKANCREASPDLFFPERGRRVGAARAICGACVVRPDCLAYALRTGQRLGVWGGLSADERQQLARRGVLTSTGEKSHSCSGGTPVPSWEDDDG